MIRFATNNDISGIISLWQEAFGDSAEEIKFFLDNKFKPENTLVYEECGEIASMLFLLEGEMRISGRDYPSYYLYAACTAIKYRGRRIMSALLKAAKKTASNRNVRYICLLPAEDSLYNYYARFGYRAIFSKRILTIYGDEIAENTEFDFNTATVSDLEELRESAFKDIDRFKWNNNDINFAFEHAEMYGGHRFVACNGYSLYSTNEHKAHVKECAFTHKNLIKIAAFLIKKHGVNEVVFSLPFYPECPIGKAEIKNSGMLLPIDYEADNLIHNIKNAYLGLTLD